ncbi:DMT family transporter [Rhodobacteraceae bacterium 2376]|uniref:DMT family transporter n=1 Tax=Rhabdonatronobacter sediminivivens TaxID=2743469 RepID=A0A7Z0HWT2_9RHOB|nr:DMT family transporter [Rhabdonatronobacter sediminivivens]NYS23590.1 DMT family transporter [Rhabdonatronobacter sediminivivens]
MSGQNQMLLVVTAASFGASPLLLTLAVQEIPPFQLAALRALLGLPLIALVALSFGKLQRPSVADGITALVGGVFVIAITYVTMAAGMQYIPSGLGGILYATMPLFTFALAALFLDDEPMRLSQLVRIALGFAGVALIVGPQLLAEGVSGAGWGTLITLISPLAYAIGNVWLRRRPPVNALMLSTGMFLGGALVLVPAALLVEGLPQLSPDGALLLTLTALVVLATVLPAVLNYVLVRRAGANAASLAMFLLPAFSVIYGSIFLAERLPLLAFLGLALVIAASLRRH